MANFDAKTLDWEWAYRQVITFSGVPFVLFEKVKVIALSSNYNGIKQESSMKTVPTGEIKLQPLDESVGENSKKKLGERVIDAE